MANQEFERSIPLIDLSLLDGPQRGYLLEKVNKACEEFGFFQVINHGLDLNLLCNVLGDSKEFFSLPDNQKAKLETDRSPVGYVSKSGVSGVPDRKEHFFAHDGDNPASKYNVWPHNPSSFKSTAQSLMLEARKATKFLINLLSESLGLDESLGSLYKAADSLIMLKYPASPAGYKSPVLAKHRDGDILTIVAQLNNTPGLEVLYEEKKGQEIWIPVKPVENALVINVGDVLQVWSNGRYKSVMHRVAAAQKDRYSFAYFHIPAAATQIYPLAAFTKNEKPKYKSFTHGEYLQLRYENKKLNSTNSKEITIEHYAI